MYKTLLFQQRWMTAWMLHAKTIRRARIVSLVMNVSVLRVSLELTAVNQVMCSIIGVEMHSVSVSNNFNLLSDMTTLYVTSYRSSRDAQHHSTSSEPKPFPGTACQPDLWSWRKPSSPVPVVQRWNRDSWCLPSLSLHWRGRSRRPWQLHLHCH